MSTPETADDESGGKTDIIVPSRRAAPVRSKEQIRNKTSLTMMEDLGFDVELNYVEKGFGVSEYTRTEI